MVNYSYSIYYNAISLLIKESLYLPLFAKYAPALGTQKRPPRAVFFGAQMGPITPRRFAAAPKGATGGRPPDPLPSPFSRCADDFLFIDRCACVLAPMGASTPRR